MKRIDVLQVKNCVSLGVTEVFTSSIMPLKFLSCLFGGANVADARKRTPKCGVPTKQTDWTTIGAKSAFFRRQTAAAANLAVLYNYHCFHFINVGNSPRTDLSTDGNLD